MAVEDALERAEGWLGWNGNAIMGWGSLWTPHKALRRISDHLVDHLAQIESRVARIPDVTDPWHGRMLTFGTDWAPFTEQELDEAGARIRRLSQVIAIRLRVLKTELDTPAGEEWTIRSIADHLAESTADYASTPPATPLIRGSSAAS